MNIPDVLFISLYNGYIRRSLGTYCVKMAIFIRSLVTSEVGASTPGMMSSITIWVGVGYEKVTILMIK